MLNADVVTVGFDSYALVWKRKAHRLPGMTNYRIGPHRTASDLWASQRQQTYIDS